MSREIKPREWTISNWGVEDSISGPLHDTADAVRVIEYWAYEEARAEIERLKHDNHYLRNQLTFKVHSDGGDKQTTLRDLHYKNDELKLMAESYRAKLAKYESVLQSCAMQKSDLPCFEEARKALEAE